MADRTPEQPDTESPPTPATTAKPGYRIDLDGLRGVAITLVAVFHIWFGRVSGGVDVFLTLSGYFFIGSLLKHAIGSQSADVGLWATVNPWQRLTRLARRLLPAMIAVLAAIMVLTVLIISDLRWSSLGEEVVASALYYQNWHLAEASQDYAAANPVTSPMQHLWSMSVQGQFFLVTMLAALALAGGIKLIAQVPALRRTGSPTGVKVIVGVSLAAVTAVSFAWASYRHGINQPFNYYDTIARTWEPLAGGLLAVWLPRTRVSNAVRSVVALIGLGLIVSCGWWLSGVDEYPAAWALVPVGATLLIIWSGATAQQDGPQVEQPVVNRMLAHRRIVWLGSISYSLYLWHWPLLIFWLAYTNSAHASIPAGTVLIVVSLVIAWLSTRFIEEPLRGKRKTKPSAVDAPQKTTRRSRLAYAPVLATVLTLVVAGGYAAIDRWDAYATSRDTPHTENLDVRYYPGARAFLDPAIEVPKNQPVQPAYFQAPKDWPPSSPDGCIVDFTGKLGNVYGTVKPEYANPTCEYGDVNATRVLALAGGSHAEYWLTALDALGKKLGFKVVTFLRMGCPLTADPAPTKPSSSSPDGATPYPECAEFNRETFDKITKLKPDVVFTNSTRPARGAPGDATPADYTDIYAKYQAAGIKLVGVRDTPWTHNAKEPPICLSQRGTADTCGAPRAGAYAPEDPAIAAFADKTRFPSVSLLDFSDAVCEPATTPNAYCPAVIGNILVYKDWHHLSATFVRSLTPALEQRLGAALRDLGLTWWTPEGARVTG